MKILVKHRKLIIFTLVALFVISVLILQCVSLDSTAENFEAECETIKRQTSVLSSEEAKSTNFGMIRKSLKDESLELSAEAILREAERQSYQIHAADYLDLFSKHWMCVYEKEFGLIEMVYIREIDSSSCEVNSYEITAKAPEFKE